MDNQNEGCRSFAEIVVWRYGQAVRSARQRSRVVIDKMGFVRFKGNQAAIRDIGAVKQTVDELIMQ